MPGGKMSAIIAKQCGHTRRNGTPLNTGTSVHRWLLAFSDIKRKENVALTIYK